MPNGKKKKGHKMATHKRKKRLRKNRHKRVSKPHRPKALITTFKHDGACHRN